MQIRDLQKSDIAQASHIVGINYGKAYEQSSRKEMEAMFKNTIVPPHYIVAEEQGKIIGLSGYIQSWMDYDVYNVFWVNVHPDRQHKGIGTLIMEQTIQKIKESSDAKMILLSTTKPGFYTEKFGFRVLSPVQQSDYILMCLDI